ncbi:MAG: ACT domain-containing protein [Candidatus Aenigmatarchaeota archaeon]
MKRAVGGRLKQFDIEAGGEVGALANLCEMIASNAINIKAIATDGNGRVRIVTEDENTTRRTLQKSRVFFIESDVISLRLIDRPGELAKITRLLANHKININSVYILGRNPERKETEIALEVSDLVGATKVLGQMA